jgi:trans-aconitate methyltransferase
MKLYEEYDWNTYTQIYSKQLKEDKEIQYLFNNTKIVGDKIESNGDFIHPNIHHILTKIVQCKPTSVFELGFGAGHWIYNIHNLFPNIKIGGIELLESQITFGREYLKIPDDFFNDNDLFLGDWSVYGTYKLVKYPFEFVYTNAVLQHLNTEKAVSFIKNIIGLEPKHIVLVDGDANHDWEELWKLSEIYNYYDRDTSQPQDSRCSLWKDFRKKTTIENK